MTILILTNNYALFVCGLAVMSLSILLVSLGCYCRRKSYGKGKAATSLLNNLGKDTNGFHRYNELNSDDEDLTTIRKNMDDVSKNRISLNMNNSSCRYSKLEDTDSKKLLVGSDDDEENEERVFVR